MAESRGLAEPLNTVVETQVGTRVPGLSIVGLDGDGASLRASRGAADLATDTEMSPDTICNWFSMTSR